MICVQCKAEFTQTRPGHIYCGRECKREAYKRADPRLVPSVACACAHCGTEFSRRAAHQIFCSEACRDRAGAVRSVAARAILQRKCPRCRSMFDTRNSRQVFCSESCEPVAERPGQHQCKICRSFFDAKLAYASMCSVRCRKAAVKAKQRATADNTPLDAEGEILVRDLEECPRRLKLARFIDRFEGGMTYYQGPLRPVWLSPPRASR